MQIYSTIYFNKKNLLLQLTFKTYAEVVKLADALDSKSSGLIPRAGSSPAFGTKINRVKSKYLARFVFLSNLVGLELGASKLVCVFAKGEKTVQWTVLREAREKQVPPSAPQIKNPFDMGSLFVCIRV